MRGKYSMAGPSRSREAGASGPALIFAKRPCGTLIYRGASPREGWLTTRSLAGRVLLVVPCVTQKIDHLSGALMTQRARAGG